MFLPSGPEILRDFYTICALTPGDYDSVDAGKQENFTFFNTLKLILNN